MTKKTDDKPWSDRDHQRSLEREHHMEALPGVVRNEAYRRARIGIGILRAHGKAAAFMYIDNEYADLARLLKRAYRAGKKAGPT